MDTHVLTHVHAARSTHTQAQDWLACLPRLNSRAQTREIRDQRPEATWSGLETRLESRRAQEALGARGRPALLECRAVKLWVALMDVVIKLNDGPFRTLLY